ncbi:MAG: hypothetical protein VW268_04575 [Rhodospirillaceae bacterium]
MSDDQVKDHLVELVSSVSHANGVFRITLGQQVEAGSARPVTRLMIPANQLQAILRGIADGANEIREKLQSQAGDGGDDGDNGKDDKKPAAKAKSVKK